MCEGDTDGGVVSLQMRGAERIATCPACGKAFRGRNRHQNLQQHMLTHTGERPFACPHCPYTARQKPHMKGHILRLHPEAVGAALPSSL